MTRSLLAALIVLLPLSASAQTIYKCIDANGSTSYASTQLDNNCKVISSAPSSEAHPQKKINSSTKPISIGGSKTIHPPKESSGSGVFISKGFVLTSNHVVDRCDVVFVGKSSLRAVIKATDKVNDLALLNISEEINSSQVVSVREDDLRLGESIAVVGFPLRGLLSSDLNVTFGSISSIKGLRDASNLFQFSAPVQPGNSGGPILDLSGSLLGIVMGGLDVAKLQTATGITPQNVNFAVPISVIKQFAGNAKISLKINLERKQLRGDELASISRQFVVPILCNIKN